MADNSEVFKPPFRVIQNETGAEVLDALGWIISSLISPHKAQWLRDRLNRQPEDIDAPGGWVFVPREPTEAMVDACFEAHARSEMAFAPVPEQWAAMLAASPTIAAPGDDATELRLCLGNLLARIFRDGGQTTDAFPSLQEAVSFADTLCAEYIVDAEQFRALSPTIAAPGGWILPPDAVNDLQRATIEKTIAHAKLGHWTNVIVRKDSVESRYDGDWIQCLQAVPAAHPVVSPAGRGRKRKPQPFPSHHRRRTVSDHTRAAFEQWAEDRGYPTRRSEALPETYYYSPTSAAWDAWQHLTALSRAQPTWADAAEEIEAAAEAVHVSYLKTAARLGWPVKPAVDMPYADLSEDAKELDRETARAAITAILQRHGGGWDAAIEAAAKVADGWLQQFSDRKIDFVDAQKYACDAVADIRDAIRALRTEPETTPLPRP